MGSIVIEGFQPHSGDHGTLAHLVECYREVFADPPWNEWLKCAVCGSSWGKPRVAELASMRFLHCGQLVVDYWPHAKVVSDLLGALEPISVVWLAVERIQDDARVVGFTWGSPLATLWHKFEPELRACLQRELGPHPSEDPSIIYQTEIGVRASYRHRGLARQLAARRNQDFLDRGFRTGVLKVREKPEPSVTFLWYSRLGYRVVHRFPPEDGRVVLVRELEPNLFDSPPASS